MSSTRNEAFKFKVIGDFTRMTYSRHKTLPAAIKARKALEKLWGWCHPGSEPRVVEIMP